MRYFSYFFNIAAEKVIRLLPPLIINKEEADLLVAGLCQCIQEFYQKP